MTYVTTTDEKRRARWVRIFGTDRLPVKSIYPRLQVIPLVGEVAAYDLDAKRVNRFAVSQLAHNRSAMRGIDYVEAYNQIMRDGWPIPAAGCAVEAGEGSSSPPLVASYSHIGAPLPTSYRAN